LTIFFFRIIYETSFNFESYKSKTVLLHKSKIKTPKSNLLIFH